MSPRKARRLPSGVPRKPRGEAVRGSRPAAAADAAPAVRLGPELRESWPDGDWVVRGVPGGASLKPYRCPGCDQEILPGVAHVVAWPAHGPGPSDRRHWHRACWRNRARRPPGRRAGG